METNRQGIEKNENETRERIEALHNESVTFIYSTRLGFEKIIEFADEELYDG